MCVCVCVCVDIWRCKYTICVYVFVCLLENSKEYMIMKCLIMMNRILWSY